MSEFRDFTRPDRCARATTLLQERVAARLTACAVPAKHAAILARRYVTGATRDIIQRHVKMHRRWATSGTAAPQPIVSLLNAVEKRGQTTIALPRCSGCRGLLLAGVPLNGTLIRGWFCHDCQWRSPQVHCSRCGKRVLVRALMPDGPICQHCSAIDASTWQPCRTCGVRGNLAPYDNSCPHCRKPCESPIARGAFCWTCGVQTKRAYWTHCRACQERSFVQSALRRIPAFRPLQEWLFSCIERTGRSGFLALRGPYGAALRVLGANGSVDFEWLDQLANVTRAHLTADLLATGVIVAADLDPVSRFERWVARLDVASLTSEHRRALMQYVRWSMVFHDRRRLLARPALNRFKGRCAEVHAIMRFFENLQSSGRSLGKCNRADLERFGVGASVLTFVRWARKQQLTHCIVPAKVKARELVGLGTAQRDAMISRLLTDESLPLDLRVAGLLVHFGFDGVRTLALRLTDIQDGSPVRINVGRGQYCMRADVGALVVRLRDAPVRTHPHHYHQQPSPYLFPGRFVGTPCGLTTLYKLLRCHGIRIRPARNAFFLAMSQRLIWLKVALKALDLHICGISQWRAASNGKYALYYANYRRPGVAGAAAGRLRP